MNEVKRGRGRPPKVKTQTKVNKKSKYKQLTTKTHNNVKKEKCIESNIISLGNGLYKCTICPYSSRNIGIQNYFRRHCGLIPYKKYHQSQPSNQIRSTPSELPVEAVGAEASNISLPKNTSLNKRIIEVENNLNKLKESLDKILQDNSLLAEKEAKTKKAFENLQKENSALHGRIMKQVSQSNILLKSSINNDATERAQQENMVLQEQLQRTFQENVLMKNEEKEINEKYLEQKKQNSEIDEKRKAIELEYSEEKMIGALYHDIFSKQQKKIDLLKNLLQENYSNLQLDDETSTSSKKNSLEIHTIYDYSSENGDVIGPDFVVTNLKNSNTKPSSDLSKFKGESESKIRVKHKQIDAENKISDFVKDSTQYNSCEVTSKSDSIEFRSEKSSDGKLSIHKCNLCTDFQHTKLMLMMRHLANAHEDHSVLLCSDCRYATKSKVMLDKHLKNGHAKHRKR